MRLLRESLLSSLVMGVVLCLYLVAVITVLLALRDSRDRGSKRENLRRCEIASDRNFRTHKTG